MLTGAICAILSVAAPLLCANQLERMEGEWRVVKVVLPNEDITDEFKEERYVLRSGSFTPGKGSKYFYGELHLRAMTLNGQVDLESPNISRPNRSSRQLAIYELTDDSFKLCVSLKSVGAQEDGSVVPPENVKRPTRFGEPGSYRLEFKRVK